MKKLFKKLIFLLALLVIATIKLIRKLISLLYTIFKVVTKREIVIVKKRQYKKAIFF